jgi:hypothetical protein
MAFQLFTTCVGGSTRHAAEARSGSTPLRRDSRRRSQLARQAIGTRTEATPAEVPSSDAGDTPSPREREVDCATGCRLPDWNRAKQIMQVQGGVLLLGAVEATVHHVRPTPAYLQPGGLEGFASVQENRGRRLASGCRAHQPGGRGFKSRPSYCRPYGGRLRLLRAFGPKRSSRSRASSSHRPFATSLPSLCATSSGASA